jgi:hypothetical protein
MVRARALFRLLLFAAARTLLHRFKFNFYVRLYPSAIVRKFHADQTLTPAPKGKNSAQGCTIS